MSSDYLIRARRQGAVRIADLYLQNAAADGNSIVEVSYDNLDSAEYVAEYVTTKYTGSTARVEKPRGVIGRSRYWVTFTI
jgi:hypothetical protein